MLKQVEADVDGPAAFVEVLAQRFGADRLMWGSDYSQTHDRPYADCVALARRAADRLSAPQRDWFLGKTALAMWPELPPGAHLPL